MLPARYANGRAALVHDAQVTLGEDALTLIAGGTQSQWPYDELRRADDNNGRIALRRHPDTGERLMLELEHAPALKAAAPILFARRAMGRESGVVVGALAAVALSLGGGLLIGVPMAAEPLARYMPPRYQEQIGEIAWSQINAMTETCAAPEDQKGQAALVDLMTRLAEQAGVEAREKVDIFVVTAGFPNAFALPDGSIVVTQELIALAEAPEELAGVIAHEIGHVAHHHAMANVIRQVGAGIFFDVVFGGAGAGQAIAIASVNLAALRYSRDDENEADIFALNALDAAQIDPGALARFFERIRDVEQEEGVDIPTLLNSHPPTAARIAAARARAAADRQPAMSPEAWRSVQAMCGMDAGDYRTDISGNPTPVRGANTPPAGKPAVADKPAVAEK